MQPFIIHDALVSPGCTLPPPAAEQAASASVCVCACARACMREKDRATGRETESVLPTAVEQAACASVCHASVCE